MSSYELAFVALAVSLLAAGFSGWQGLTSHLARTRPRPASWTVEFISLRNGSIWKLHNTGGSTGTNVTLTATAAHSENPEGATHQMIANEAIPPNESRELSGSVNKVDPKLTHVRNAEGTFNRVDPTHPEATHLFTQRAVVEWFDYRGKRRSAKIRLW